MYHVLFKVVPTETGNPVVTKHTYSGGRQAALTVAAELLRSETLVDCSFHPLELRKALSTAACVYVYRGFKTDLQKRDKESYVYVTTIYPDITLRKPEDIETRNNPFGQPK